MYAPESAVALAWHMHAVLNSNDILADTKVALKHNLYEPDSKELTQHAKWASNMSNA